MKYRAEKNHVWDGDELAVTVWASPVDETRLQGESWLAMRERTQPAREESTAESVENAIVICALLNMRNYQPNA